MNKVLVFVLVAVGALLVGILVLTFFTGVGAYLAFGGMSGSGVVITENRSVADFDQVRICCGMKLVLRQGEPTTVQITGDDNLVSRIKTEVEGDTLVVGYESIGRAMRPGQRIVCDVTAPVIHGVEISGGVAFESSNLITDRFALEISGGSRAQIDRLEAETFGLDASGGGDTSIGAGHVTDQAIHLSGGDRYDAADLESQQADIKVSGGSNATVWVVESLAVKASGGSKVNYYGSPTVTQDTSGGSQVQSKGER